MKGKAYFNVMNGYKKSKSLSQSNTVLSYKKQRDDSIVKIKKIFSTQTLKYAIYCLYFNTHTIIYIFSFENYCTFQYKIIIVVIIML